MVKLEKVLQLKGLIYQNTWISVWIKAQSCSFLIVILVYITYTEMTSSFKAKVKGTKNKYKLKVLSKWTTIKKTEKYIFIAKIA